MISLIHPSRGRPTKSACNAKEWLDKSGVETELIVSLDADDHIPMYYAAYRDSTCRLESNQYQFIISGNSCVVQATNYAAQRSKGDILIYLSDDFKCFPGWGEAIMKEFEGVTGPMLLKVDDCLQKFDVPVLTIPIMNRALYNLLGYFFHPDFKSMHCDEHLYQRCLRLGVIKKAPHLKFQHWHVSNGMAENDETYRRSAANWDQGKQMMRKHRRLGFTQ